MHRICFWVQGQEPLCPVPAALILPHSLVSSSYAQVVLHLWPLLPPQWPLCSIQADSPQGSQSTWRVTRKSVFVKESVSRAHAFCSLGWC